MHDNPWPADKHSGLMAVINQSIVIVALKKTLAVLIDVDNNTLCIAKQMLEVISVMKGQCGEWI